MNEKQKRSRATDALPPELAAAMAAAGKIAASAAAAEVAKAAIRGAKKIVGKKKAEPEKPTIILTDDD